VGETHGIGYIMRQPCKGLNVQTHTIARCRPEESAIKQWFTIE